MGANHNDKWIWLRLVAVAVLYFTSYTALRDVSVSYWMLPAGLRLSCLLLMPYRYWPGLLVGEMLWLGKLSYDCRDTLGHTWALMNLFPAIALAMPIVYWCRSRLAVISTKQTVRINALLLCTLFISLVAAARSFAFAYVSNMAYIPPTGQIKDPITFAWAEHYFVGEYLGILSMVPLVLMTWKVGLETPLCSWRERLSNSRLVLDAVALVLPSLVLLMEIATHTKGDLAQIARIAMFMPVALLALRHGWYGAALSGSFASIAIVVVMPALYDPATMQAEIFIAFTISIMLMLGARIATLNMREDSDRKDVQLALQVAQHGLYMGELRMQHAADTIDQIATSVLNVQGHLLERLRYLLSPAEELHFSKQVNVSKYEAFQLANRLAPRALQTGGLALTLQDASLAHAFTSANIDFACEIRGDIDALSAHLQLAFYRLACEAGTFLFEQATLSHAYLQVRVGHARGRRWVAVRMDGFHASHAQDLMPASIACAQFKAQVGAAGAGIDALRDQAFIYGGTAHLRSTARGTRLALLLHDADARLARVQ
ncbi:MASE1 domain-containing protein [Paraburkholderia agricolaris]|uniref:MASE1 domain-containing protein n=1 Tax=Paraburkholderia agricolaris TaxID=2152888 RepID=A0ABW8ZM52_9BURK